MLNVHLAECCATCGLYAHVQERHGKQWRYSTGYCKYRPPSSHRSKEGRRTHATNWCDNWVKGSNMDVSKAILAETDRRMDAKARGDAVDLDDPAVLKARIAELEAQLAAEDAKDVTPKEGN